MKYIALLLLSCFLFNCSTKRYPSEENNLEETGRIKKELQEKFGWEPWHREIKDIEAKQTTVHVQIPTIMNYEDAKAVCRAVSDIYYAKPENKDKTVKLFDNGFEVELVIQRNGIGGECR